MKRNILFLFIITFLIGCSKEPVPIHFGEDGCSYCRMIISDQRFGGELLTSKGKAYKFDSIECMTAYIIKEKKGSEKLYSLWTIDFNNPETFVDATQAWYLHSEELKSPMGANLSSFKNNTEVKTVQNIYNGEAIRWQQVQDLVQQEWLK